MIKVIIYHFAWSLPQGIRVKGKGRNPSMHCSEYSTMCLEMSWLIDLLTV